MKDADDPKYKPIAKANYKIFSSLLKKLSRPGTDIISDSSPIDNALQATAYGVCSGVKTEVLQKHLATGFQVGWSLYRTWDAEQISGLKLLDLLYIGTVLGLDAPVKKLAAVKKMLPEDSKDFSLGFTPAEVVRYVKGLQLVLLNKNAAALKELTNGIKANKKEIQARKKYWRIKEYYVVCSEALIALIKKDEKKFATAFLEIVKAQEKKWQELPLGPEDGLGLLSMAALALCVLAKKHKVSVPEVRSSVMPIALIQSKTKLKLATFKLGKKEQPKFEFQVLSHYSVD